MKNVSATEEMEPATQEEKDDKQAEKRTAISAHVVYEAVRREGAEELKRPTAALAWSALAAGLSMGFSLVSEGLIQSMLPDAPWRPLLSEFGYSVGFLIVILGRQQLFTENTLTVILPLFREWNTATVKNVCRLWLVVLAGNLLGTLVFAWFIGHTAVFDDALQQVFATIGHEAMRAGFLTTMLRAIFAGWLIALMIWLLPFAESGRVIVIILLTFLIGIGGFPHIVAGAVEVLYMATTGAATWSTCIGGYMLPTLLGNILGGVALVAMLNHAQVVAGGGQDM
jgi:formate/nitrite transporter FocA (FNT family)